MTEHYEVVGGELPTLDDPLLVVMLTGWIDASGAPAAAAAAFEEECKVDTIVSFDTDTFVDYRARRPTMEVRDGLNSRLGWPSIELKAGASEGGRDVLVLSGVEPDSAWQAFATAVGELAEELGVAKVVGLGAYPIGVPHSRPTRLSATTPDPELLATLPGSKNSVDVPAGIISLLEHELTDRGIPALTLWAQVPHYVATMAYPGGAAALLDGLREITGVDIGAEQLRREAVLQRGRLDALVAGNDEHQAMLRQLEQAYDEMVAAEGQTGLGLVDPENLPSGDELAAELERFLRDQG
jgi:predicted ATP-grasp superfamily ATP-dependent carboligase